MKMISNIDQTKDIEVRIFEEFRSIALHEAKKEFRNLEMRRTRVSTVAYARNEEVMELLNLAMNRNFSVRIYEFSHRCGPGECWGFMGNTVKGRA